MLEPITSRGWEMNMRLKQHRPTACFALREHGHPAPVRRFRRGGARFSRPRSALAILLSAASLLALAGTFAVAAGPACAATVSNYPAAGIGEPYAIAAG